MQLKYLAVKVARQVQSQDLAILVVATSRVVKEASPPNPAKVAVLHPAMVRHIGPLDVRSHRYQRLQANRPRLQVK